MSEAATTQTRLAGHVDRPGPRHADRARRAVRDGGDRHPRRADPDLEERAADAARGRRGVHAHGEQIFLVYEDERVSFEAFHRAVAALAHDLAAEGVVKGDRVAVVMRNLPEWPVAFYAAASLGAIVTPLNAWWTGPELEYGLTDSGAKVAIARRRAARAAGRASAATART